MVPATVTPFLSDESIDTAALRKLMRWNMSQGADGSIGSTFNFMFYHYRRIYDLFLEHHIDEALALQVRANTIMEALCKAGLIPAIKYVLSTMGIEAGIPRRPFKELTEDQKAKIKEVVDQNILLS